MHFKPIPRLSVYLLLVQCFANECFSQGRENETDGGEWMKNDSVIVSRGCPVDHELPCVPKCCDIYDSYNNGRECSATVDYQFLPEFADCPNTTDYFRELDIQNRYEYFIGDPCEKAKYILDVLAFPEDEHYLYSNGTLFYGNRLLTMEEFCVESVNGTPRVFVCFQGPKKSEFKFILYPTGLLISIPLLLLTAAVYLGFERFRDVQGKSLACHVTCLAIAYFFLSLVQLASQELDGDVCTAAAFIIQFFFVASFFWLNVLCYDTWRNIRTGYHDTAESRKSERMKFVYYSMYAWYGPCLLTIISLVMDLEPAIPESLIKPKFGHQSCWFQSDTAALNYFYGPVGFLIAINILFFVLSARKIYCDQKDYVKLKRASGSCDGTESKIPAKVKMYIRALKRCVLLFCVMGINWAAEVISWIIGGSDLIWLVTDVFNTLQGLIIFYIFVIKPRNVREAVLGKLHCCLKFFECSRCFGEKPKETKRSQYFQPALDEEKSAFSCPRETNIRYIDASMNSLISDL